MTEAMKRIFIAALAGLCCFFVGSNGWAQQDGTAETADDAGFQSLFNGRDLTGWDFDPRFWRVEEGTLVGQTTEEIRAESNTFLIRDDQEFSDFELRFSYQVEGFNSGVQYRSQRQDGWGVKGYQADFEAKWHDGQEDRFSGMFFEENGRMFLGQRGQVVIVRPPTRDENKADIEVIGAVGNARELENHIKRNDWNGYIVIAREFQFTHIINGQVMTIAYDEDLQHRTRSGKFAFQLHAGPPMQIRLKDIRVRRLD
jgi:hypothetical protein